MCSVLGVMNRYVSKKKGQILQRYNSLGRSSLSSGHHPDTLVIESHAALVVRVPLLYPRTERDARIYGDTRNR